MNRSTRRDVGAILCMRSVHAVSPVGDVPKVMAWGEGTASRLGVAEVSGASPQHGKHAV